LREVAEALGLSYQRVHQIVDVSTGKGALKNCTGAAARVCGFCGRPQEDARKLVAGPGLFICVRCVDWAAEVIAEGEPRTDHAALASVESGDARARCGFCGKRRGRVSGMAEAPLRPRAGKAGRCDRAGVRICADCLVLCEEIFAEAGVRS
jgi:ClpX C4-type zinc finger